MEETSVQTRHLANLAGAIVEAVEGEPRTVERFRSMYGPVTVIRDDHAADVALHGRGVTVHVRFDREADHNR